MVWQDAKELAMKLGDKPKDPRWKVRTKALRDRRTKLFQDLNGLLHKMEGRLYAAPSLIKDKYVCACVRVCVHACLPVQAR